jgi:uncharacterized membrane protein YhhN
MSEKNIWLYAFGVVAAAELFAEIAPNERLVFFTKPLLMPLLAVWLARNTRPKAGGAFLRSAVLGAFGFSTLGDVLLMFAGRPGGNVFFILGLLAFLMAHLSYIGGFSSILKWNRGYLHRRPLWVVLFLVYLVVFLRLLWPGIPQGLHLPVAVYSGVISGMALSAIHLRGHVGSAVFVPLLSGVLLFMLSDSLIAVNKFGASFPGARVAIMTTYIAGQYLIARSVYLQLKQD